MTPKEKLLKMKTYQEFDENRELFKDLKPDKEIIEHLSKITPKSPNPQEELFKTPPNQGGTIGRMKNYTEEELYTTLSDGRRVIGDRR